MTSLLEQNRWLRDPEQRARLLRNSAASSSAVEGIRKPYADVHDKQTAPKKTVRTSPAPPQKSV